jgi:hypothetical protein
MTENDGVWNKVLRITFEPKKDDIKERWRELHNVEIYHLNCSFNIISVLK